MKRLCSLVLVVWCATVSGHAPAPACPTQSPTRSPDVGFEPTTMEVADAMLRLAGVGPNDVVYDLGSGDGRIVNLAARAYGARGVGIELDPHLVTKAREAALAANVADKTTFVEGDLFAADISGATVVTLYLWPSVNDRLKWKLRRELRPGTRIVSNTFGIAGWPPDVTVASDRGRSLMLWTVPRPPLRVPDVEFDPTLQSVVKEMLQLAGVGPGDVVYDLGSGDGRIPIIAAQDFAAQGVGVEIDPRLVDISRRVARDASLADKVSFVEGDLFAADIAKASVVTLCLSANVNARLEEKLRRELRPGARVVSHEHPVGAWVPDRVARGRDGKPLFLWTVR